MSGHGAAATSCSMPRGRNGERIERLDWRLPIPLVGKEVASQWRDMELSAY